MERRIESRLPRSRTQLAPRMLKCGRARQHPLNSKAISSGLLIASLVLLTGLTVPASAAPLVGGTGNWTQTDSPVVATVASQETIQVTFQNNLNVTVLGLVVVVVHNSQGQTIFLSGSTALNIPASQSLTAYAVIFGIAHGSYDTTIFAMTPNGVAISAPITATLAL